jgi:hypothetical protein
VNRARRAMSIMKKGRALATAKLKTIGGEIEQQFLQAIQEANKAPLAGARNLPVLDGIDRRGDFTHLQENVLLIAAKILRESGHVFTFGNSVVMQLGDPTTPDVSLTPLRTGTTVESCARGLLANLFVCQLGDKQFPPPKWFLEVLLNAEPVLGQLPRIRHYARRPIFDENFVLLSPGWHPTPSRGL